MSTDSIWSFVDLQSGDFTSRIYGGPVGDLEANTPAGCLAVIGRWPADAWRYDAAAQCVVPREQLTDGDFAKAQAKLERDTLISMAAAEQLQQRSIRELLLALATGASVPTDSVARLHALDQDIEAQRERLTAIRSATSLDGLPS